MGLPLSFFPTLVTLSFASPTAELACTISAAASTVDEKLNLEQQPWQRRKGGMSE
jgi:hypothetical protein